MIPKIIFSRTYEEHLDRLQQVLERLRLHGLKLSPEKCTFFQKKVKFLGFIVSANGIETDKDKIQKVDDWPHPTSPEDVRRFLGFCGYYRKFVKGFASIAKPLNALLPHTKKKGKTKKDETVPWNWTSEHETAFQTLKTALVNPPVLGYPDLDIPFEVHTDASSRGLGEVLYQKQECTLRVIAYASRGLSGSERNYPAHKLEYLALKWAVTNKFTDYLYGRKFTVVTDNNPLTYVLTTAKLDATGHRWLAALSAYDFNIIYRPGIHNGDADALSRLPSQDNFIETSLKDITCESVKAVCNSLIIHTPVLETISMSDILTYLQGSFVLTQIVLCWHKP